MSVSNHLLSLEAWLLDLANPSAHTHILRSTIHDKGVDDSNHLF